MLTYFKLIILKKSVTIYDEHTKCHDFSHFTDILNVGTREPLSRNIYPSQAYMKTS